MSFTLKNTPVVYRPYPYSTEERKEELKTLLDRYRQRIGAQWDEVKDDTLHYGKQALVIGSVVAGVYLLMEAVLPDAEDTNAVSHRVKTKNNHSSTAGAVQGMVWTLALAWARKRLTNFLEAEQHTNAQSNP